VCLPQVQRLADLRDDLSFEEASVLVGKCIVLKAAVVARPLALARGRHLPGLMKMPIMTGIFF